MPRQEFHGFNVGEQTTLFYRDTPSGIEGFVIDNKLLLESMKERVLDERGLSQAVDVEAKAGLSSLSKRVVEEVGAYSHQFTEPFSALEASLRLAPLDAPVSEQMLMPLTLLIGSLVVLGLFFLYRLSKTQVEFAERQSNFVSAVTHELKTPLTAIRLHGEMLQEGLVESPEKAQEYYGTITAQAERLSRLIGNVLWLSDVERNPGGEIRLASLRDPVLQAVKALRPHVEKSGFELVVDLPSTIPKVLLDVDSVEQILFNLVENAMKYAKGAADKRVTLGCEVKENAVELFVRDRGPGVPQARLKKIFEAFYRGENELTRKNSGTGLGLALVDLLARRMNAAVSARLMDPGLSVVVSLPRKSES